MEPAEFISRSFTTAWSNTPNMIGNKPPNPQFQQAPNISTILPQTILPDTSKLGFAPVGVIQSKREPYAVEYYFGKYGQLETRLGTSLGK
jgi:hypothetical protein